MGKKVKVVCILSAPRSGSSALSSLLAGMGLQLGAREKLKKGDEYNPGGYYELERVLDINEKILREKVDPVIWEIGSSLGWSRQKTVNAIEYFSWTVARTPVRIQEVSDSSKNAIRDITRTMSQTKEYWLLKDTRMCATFPVWEEYIEPICIVLWRHPVEVQHSLKKMAGIPEKIALQLWFAYTRMAFTVSGKHPRICLSYQELIENPGETRERLERYLSGQGIDVSRSPGPEEAYIDASLYRNREREGVILTSNQKELYEALIAGDFKKIENMDEENTDTSLVPLIGMATFLNGELSRRPGRRFINAVADIYHSIFGR